MGHHLLVAGCIAAWALLGAGCGSEAKKPEAPKPVEQGRPETNKVQAASAVGYDGDALRRSVDGMLDKAEQRNKETGDAMNQAGGTNDGK